MWREAVNPGQPLIPSAQNKKPRVSPQQLYWVFICNDLQAFEHNVIFLTVGEASQGLVVGREGWR